MKASDILIIERVADAKADDVAGRYQSDLARWTITSTKEGKRQTIVRRFCLLRKIMRISIKNLAGQSYTEMEK